MRGSVLFRGSFSKGLALGAHHSNGVVAARCCQAELLHVCVLLHCLGEVLQRRDRNILEGGEKKHIEIPFGFWASLCSFKPPITAAQHLDVVQVDLCQRGIIGPDPLQGLLHIRGVGRLIKNRFDLLSFNDICQMAWGAEPRSLRLST